MPTSQADTFAQAHYFDNWHHLLRCTRKEFIDLIHTQLDPLKQEDRLAQLRTFSGRLSGSESAYAFFHYSLYGDAA